MKKNYDLSLQARVREVINHFSKGVLKEFCQTYGLTYTTLHSFLNGTGSPRTSLITDIVNKCSVSAEWMLTGRGSMLNKASKYEISYQVSEVPPGIPIYDIQATAGAVTLPNMDQPEVPVGFIDMPAFRGCDFAVTVRGNSMSDYIIHGDVIICKRYDFSAYINYGQAYVVVTSQEVMVKYVKKGKDQMHVALVSENKEFDTIELPMKSILHLYVVKGVIRQTTI
jgi:phage repressor protein C with HTH and peptisase S24 domain